MPEKAPRRLDSSTADFDAALARLTEFDAKEDAAVEAAVGAILADVRARGDAAVLEYTARFDRIRAVSVAALELSTSECRAAFEGLPPGERDALVTAAQRIRAFHERQRGESWTMTEADGTRLGQKVTALDRVGLYVPGGKAAYPSSVLMNALPAKVAGVPEIVMVSPMPKPLVLAAAPLAEVDRVIGIGGAQAVGALAYGTRSVPRVDKIVGPGNVYVAEAKRQVFGQVGIDMVAGPSEILVIADGRTPADWLAMDLFSQAEHDEAAQALLLSPQSSYLDQVELSMRKLLPAMPRREIIAASLAARGALIETRDLEEA